MKIRLFILLLAFSGEIFSAEIKEEYIYDELGRITRVKENQIVKASYCYDKTGNRKQVAVESCTETPIPVPPAAPTNLRAGSHAGGGFNISWSGVLGATYYELKFTNESLGTRRQTSTSYNTPGGQGYRPVWVKACNGYTCSAKAYF